MRTWIVACAAGSLLASPTIALGKDKPVRLEPAGGWSIDYGDWYCSLNRTYRDLDREVLFSFSREPIVSKNWLRIAFPKERGRRDDDDATVISLDGRVVTKDAHYNVFSTDKYRIREIWIDLDKVPLSEARETLQFSLPRQGTIDIAVPGFKEAWQALDTCMADLYAGFGIDQAALEAVAKPPEGDFYDAATMPEAPADFALLFWVNEAGRVDDCKLVKPSGQASVDAAMCPDIVKNARYKPALDKVGKPVRTPVFNYVPLRQVTYTSTLPPKQLTETAAR